MIVKKYIINEITCIYFYTFIILYLLYIFYSFHNHYYKTDHAIAQVSFDYLYF